MPNVLNIYCKYTISTVNPMLVLNVLAYSSTLFRSCASTLASGEMAPAPGPRAMAACSAVAWYSPKGAAARKNGTRRVQLEYCTQIHCIIIWGARIQGGLHIFSYTPWNRIAKFLNYCLYIREVCNSPCGSFLCGVTPYGLMGWSRALQKNSSAKICFSALLFATRLCKKNNFSGSKKGFIPHCSYETQRSPALHMLCIKTFFQALKTCFFHTSLMKLRQARLCKKKIRL